MDITLVMSLSTNLSIVPIMHMRRFIGFEVDTLI